MTSQSLPKPGIELIKRFEGCRLFAYPDPLSGDKPITIGWGSTKRKDGMRWELNDRISQQEADELLALQLKTDYLPRLKLIPVWSELSVNQQGALLSFGYNLGASFYEAERFGLITKMLKTKNWLVAKETFFKYRNPGTKAEEGLKRRRIAEAELFLRSPELGGGIC